MADTEPIRRRRDLSVAEVVARATTIMGEEGKSALTMRRVAADCGVTPMAIYHHVASKEDLLTLVVDAVIATSLPTEAETGGWRDSMIAFGCRLRGSLLGNPGAAAVFLRRPIVSPNLARVTEYLFATLQRGEITGPAAAEAVDAIVLVTMGSIANDVSRPPDVRERLIGQVPVSETPLIVDQIDAYAHRDAEARYRVALEWLLDGIERTPR